MKFCKPLTDNPHYVCLAVQLPNKSNNITSMHAEQHQEITGGQLQKVRLSPYLNVYVHSSNALSFYLIFNLKVSQFNNYAGQEHM